MSKAQALRYGKKDVQEILSTKRIEFIQRQRDYGTIYHTVVFKLEEMKEIEKQLNTEQIKIVWEGMIIPKPLLIAKYNLVVNSYRLLVTQLKYVENQLRQDKITETQLKEIRANGKYVKTLFDDKKAK